AVIVLVLAGLTAATAVRNSDFWLHLASGQHLIQSGFQFDEPFLHTTAGTRWVNHSWLFDVALFEIHRTLGDLWLVPLKAWLIAAVAGVMLAVRRGRGLLIPAVCTALAVLVMSPRLPLQPGLLSLLFLALTVFVLATAGEYPRRL